LGESIRDAAQQGSRHRVGRFQRQTGLEDPLDDGHSKVSADADAGNRGAATCTGGSGLSPRTGGVVLAGASSITATQTTNLCGWAGYQHRLHRLPWGPVTQQSALPGSLAAAAGRSLALSAGADQTLIERWITVGRQRAAIARAMPHAGTGWPGSGYTTMAARGPRSRQTVPIRL
jgi:hypothetical protein